MKLAFEDWIDEQNLGHSATDLLREAVVCYKASANRAALLFSYVAFLSTVRDRIIASKCPELLPENKWKNYQQDLLDDDKWENTAFQATQLANNGSIFRCSEDLRHQVRYWKDRRNDCAHAKSNAIGIAHVDAFWLFLKSNLAKFVVDGGKEGLLLEIREYFDASLTPAGADPSPIVRKIPHALEPGDFAAFIEQVAKYSRGRFGTYDADRLTRATCLIDEMLQLPTNRLTTSLVDFLKSSQELVVPLLQSSPVRIQAFGDDPRFIRKLWYEYLDSVEGSDTLTIYTGLLRNGFIPHAETEEAHRHLIVNRRFNIEEADHDVLENSGFFACFKAVVFKENRLSDYYWSNEHIQPILYYLDHFPVDDQVALGIWSAFDAQNFPWYLHTPLLEFFRAVPKRREEFKSSLMAAGKTFPRMLSDLD